MVTTFIQFIKVTLVAKDYNLDVYDKMLSLFIITKYDQGGNMIVHIRDQEYVGFEDDIEYESCFYYPFKNERLISVAVLVNFVQVCNCESISINLYSEYF